MKRTILVLALTLLLSNAVPAQAAPASQGNTVSNPGNLLNNFNGIQMNGIQIQTSPNVNMRNSIWYTVLELLGFGS